MSQICFPMALDGTIEDMHRLDTFVFYVATLKMKINQLLFL